MGAQRVSRHNGRAGKSGAYSSKHNDRKFDAENADHIDSSRTHLNMYWDYQNGLRSHEEQQHGDYPSFADVEKQFYTERYSAYIAGQHERNRKRGQSARNRTVEDLLKDKRTCPEETIYQIGKQGSETPPSVLLEVLDDYRERFNVRFGEHVHILDWALHLDETTPHVHERHVFDMKNGKGEEIEPKQEKTLELMGIPLPKPNEPSNRKNNRKITFDAICRDLFIDVCKEHGLFIEEEPIYGGQAYREKNDYIIESQQVEIAQQQEAITQQQQALASLQAQQAQNSQILMQQQAEIDSNASLLDDEKAFIGSIAAQAHDSAVKVTAESVVRETQASTVRALSAFKEKNTSPDRKLKPAIRDAVNAYLDGAISMIQKRTEKLIAWIKDRLFKSDVRSKNIRMIEKEITPSIREQLKAFRQKELEASPRRKVIQRDHDSR